MRSFAQGLALVGLFLAANVVAAGVMLFLGRSFQNIAPGVESPWPWFLIGIAGVLAGYCFLRGALAHFTGVPLLQWRTGQRGGE